MAEPYLQKMDGTKWTVQDAARIYRERAGQSDPVSQLPDDQLVGRLVQDHPDRYQLIGAPGSPGGFGGPPSLNQEARNESLGYQKAKPIDVRGAVLGFASAAPDIATTIGSFGINKIPIAGRILKGTPLGVAKDVALGAVGSAIDQVAQYALGGPRAPQSWWDAIKTATWEGTKQAGFGAAAGLLHKGATGIFRAGAERPENVGAKAMSDQYSLNVPAPALATGSIAGEIGQPMQYIGETSLVGGSIANLRRSKSMVAGENAVQQELQNITPWSTGKVALAARQGQRGIKVGEQVFRKQADRAYQAFDEIAPNVTIPVRDLRDTARAMLTAEERLAETTQGSAKSFSLSPNTKQLLEDMANLGEGEQLPFVKLDKLKEIRSRLMKYTPELNAVDANQAEGLAKKFTGAITDAIQAEAGRGNALAQDALRKWQDANRFYQEGMGIFGRSNVSRMATAEIPESILGMVGSNPSQAFAVREALYEYPMRYGSTAEKAVAQRRWGIFKDQYVRDQILGGVSVPKATPNQSMDYLIGMKKRMEDVGMPTLQALFGPGGQNELQRLSDLADALSRVGVGGSPRTQTMYSMLSSVGNLFSGGMAGTSIATHNPAWLAFGLIPGLIAYSAKNRVINDLLLNGLQLAEKGRMAESKQFINKWGQKLLSQPMIATALRTADANKKAQQGYSQAKDQSGAALPPEQGGPPAFGVSMPPTRGGAVQTDRYSNPDPFGAQ